MGDGQIEANTIPSGARAVGLKSCQHPERLGEVGEWLLDCDSGEELLARVARLCETAAAEDCAAQE